VEKLYLIRKLAHMQCGVGINRHQLTRGNTEKWATGQVSIRKLLQRNYRMAKL